MQKGDLAKLAALGVSVGLLTGGCQQKDKQYQNSRNGSKGDSSAVEQLSPDMQAFYAALSAQAKKKFMELDAQHKMMAVEMANQSCNGQNKCSGMGGCANAKHSCAGENDCKGQGGAPVQDPNKAVDVQYKNQTQQRQMKNGGMQKKMNGSKSNGNSM